MKRTITQLDTFRSIHETLLSDLDKREADKAKNEPVNPDANYNRARLGAWKAADAMDDLLASFK
jgi:hypothetical protein